MKSIKTIMAVLCLAALLAGCASNANTGASDSGSQVQSMSGPNGSISAGNPLGIGPGSGLTR